MNIDLMGLNRDTKTAGPGTRLEYFTKGCIRGVINPCFGCFNESTWTFEGAKKQMETDDLVKHALEFSWNRLVTFCGGEPILQAKAIAKVAKQLKEADPSFHFVMYTAYKLDTLMKYGLKFTWVPKYGEAMRNSLMSYSASNDIYCHMEGEAIIEEKVEFTILSAEDIKELMKYIDIIVDGDYQYKKRLTKEQYMHEGWFIGSSNQRVIDAPASVLQNTLIYQDAESYNTFLAKDPYCKACMNETEDEFCSSTCNKKWDINEASKEMFV